MGNMKKWLAMMLAIVIALSDCGSIPAMAAEHMPAETEEAIFAENSEEEEEVVPEEMSSGQAPVTEAEIIGSESKESGDSDVSDEDIDEELKGEPAEFQEDEAPDSVADAREDKDTDAGADAGEDKGVDSTTDPASELPPLQIGQVGRGEELPGPEDKEFVYGLPVSFTLSDSLLLFVNYDIDGIPDREEKGMVVWSILRGAKGQPTGSASLLKEEDDWNGFETVPGSPWFIMVQSKEDREDGKSDFDRIELISGEEEARESLEEDYDYYIRASYYLGTGEEAFYAAATVPFVPFHDDTDEMPGDQSALPEDNADQIQEDTPAVEASDSEEAPEEDVPESVDSKGSEDNQGAEAEEPIAESVDFGDAGAERAPEEISSLSENDIQPKNQITELILSETNLTIQPGSTYRITARTVPEDIPVKILWESSNETIATVNESGEITAKAEGIAQITAECGDLAAVVRVEVAPLNTGEKLLDLSGDIWVAGFKRESEDFVYTGQKITQDIRVYHKDTLLREKTDYTLSYKNNINAAAYNSAKAPSITINLKGQYSGSVTLYYTIRPLEIKRIDSSNAGQNSSDEEDDTGSLSPGYEQTVKYSKSLKIPNPVLTFGNKKMAANKDFVCDYTILQKELAEEMQDGQQPDYRDGDSYTAGKVYHYTVDGIGNFTGSFTMQLVVLKDKAFDFGSATVTLGQKQYEYHGMALTKAEVVIDQVKLNKQVLDKSFYNYEVCANGIRGAYVTVYPSEAGRNAGYRGCKKVNLKLVGDRNIAEADLGENWKESITFSQKTVNKNGGIFQEKTGVLTFGEAKEPLTEGEDYTVKYSNAGKAGNVTATFTGKGRYKGTLKKRYEITPNFDKKNLTIVWGKNVKQQNGNLEVAYQKGGASPDFVLRDQDKSILKNKTDYTVKLRDNKMPGSVMSCEITGKGNYKGYTEIIQLQVTTGDIGLASITIPDKPYSTKTDGWKSTATVKDVNGKKLTAGLDYDKQLTYTYENMESGQPPQKGSTVTVTVHGAGCYENSTLTGSYRIFENNISKLKIVIDPQEYTGREITLRPVENIHVYANSNDAKKKQNEIIEDCYEIVEYKNNIKAGTAKVTLRGIKDYGGTKTYSFKIQKKTYRINRVKGITLDKTSLTLPLAEKDEAKRTLTAVITAQTNEEIANPTVIWSVSDSRIVGIEERIINTTTVAAVLTFKKEGNVTITATTQDGNRKAQCKLKIVDAPLLKQAGQTIEAEAGDTYQLELEKAESQEINLADIKWESVNPEMVSVKNDGMTGNLTMKKQGASVIKVTYHGYVQQCYVVVKGEEILPEGNYLTYHRPSGCTDDTPHINKLLRDWESAQKTNPDIYECLYIPAGVYWIDATPGEDTFGGIILTDNQTLVMSPSALLLTLGTSSGTYHVIWAFGRDNITISGGQIIGERKEHKGTGGEYGHGIQISGCTNVTIKDVDISQCWGDGIYLGLYEGWDSDGNRKKMFSSNVTVSNCNLHHNRRNNMSITDADYITIDHCQFNYASGTDPQYGIDIEPNENNPCEHVKISNSVFKGNKKASMGIIKSANDIRLENCTLDGAFYNMAGKNVVLKNTTIGGEIVDQTGGIRRE